MPNDKSKTVGKSKLIMVRSLGDTEITSDSENDRLPSLLKSHLKIFTEDGVPMPGRASVLVAYMGSNVTALSERQSLPDPSIQFCFPRFYRVKISIPVVPPSRALSRAYEPSSPE